MIPHTPLAGNGSVKSKMLSSLNLLFGCNAKSSKHLGSGTVTAFDGID
jgi:hypothetical protein